MSEKYAGLEWGQMVGCCECGNETWVR